jgi:hypothetical protein
LPFKAHMSFLPDFLTPSIEIYENEKLVDAKEILDEIKDVISTAKESITDIKNEEISKFMGTKLANYTVELHELQGWYNIVKETDDGIWNEGWTMSIQHDIDVDNVVKAINDLMTQIDNCVKYIKKCISKGL